MGGKITSVRHEVTERAQDQDQNDDMPHLRSSPDGRTVSTEPLCNCSASKGNRGKMAASSASWRSHFSEDGADNVTRDTGSGPQTACSTASSQ